MTRRTRHLAALALLLAGLEYLLVELVVARAWSRPSYDWLHNLVTDLGSTATGPNHQGLEVTSPLHALMNAGFLAQGLLVAVALALLSRLTGRRTRIALIALGGAQAVGLALLSWFATTPSMGAGALATNIAAGALAMVASNAAIIVAGLRWRALGLPRAVGHAGVVLGGGALVLSAVLTVLAAPTGLTERVAIDPFVVWQVLAGLCLLRTTRSTGDTGTPVRSAPHSTARVAPTSRTTTPTAPLTTALVAAVLALLAVGGAAACAAPAAPAPPAGPPAGHDIPGIAQDWARNWKSDDPNGLAGMFTDDATYTDRGVGKTSHGRIGVAAWQRNTYTLIPDADIHLTDAFRSGDRVTIQGLYTGHIRGAPRPFALPMATVLQLRGEQIATDTDYYNLADLLAQSGLPPTWTPPTA